MTIIRMTLLCVLLGFLPVAASSQPAPSPTEWIDDLRLGGYVIVLRHGATYSDQANTDSMSRPNVPAQRQLNDQGRAEAKSIGESMRKLRIPVGLVLTSTTQRAVDTGPYHRSQTRRRSVIKRRPMPITRTSLPGVAVVAVLNR